MSSLFRSCRHLCHLTSPTSTITARGISSSSTTAVKIMTCSGPSSAGFATLSRSTINPRVVSAEYAVRGPLVIRADEIKDEIASCLAAGKPSPYPFDKIIRCNIGNPQELGQKPLTFVRQVIAACQYPTLIDSSSLPADAVKRAREYLTEIRSMGAYTHSMGVAAIRKEVALFIEKRDGHKADPSHIFLTDGASTAVKAILQLLIRDSNDAVLTPIPQYPLYSATLSLLGGTGIPYYLDEEKCWSLTLSELEEARERGMKEGKDIRAIVVINPGNPTGQVLPLDVMKQVVAFCQKHRLVLLADEVYQENIYTETPFISFKKVCVESKADIELISFHSTSKGFIGECGQRGGYMELYNIGEDVMKDLYKLASVSLCSNTSGQVTTGVMVHPPQEGEASYDTYKQERDTIISSLKRRALTVCKVMNECSNISCQPAQGAMYVFPRLHLSNKAIAAATAAKQKPDEFYCFALLQNTGLVTVPGSGFGQRQGQWHFRITILTEEKELLTVLKRFKGFNEEFMKSYKD